MFQEAPTLPAAPGSAAMPCQRMHGITKRNRQAAFTPTTSTPMTPPTTPL